MAVASHDGQGRRSAREHTRRLLLHARSHVSLRADVSESEGCKGYSRARARAFIL